MTNEYVLKFKVTVPDIKIMHIANSLRNAIDNAIFFLVILNLLLIPCQIAMCT